MASNELTIYEGKRSARHARYGTVTSEITSVSDFLAADEGEVIDMVSGACGPLNAPK